MKRKNNYPLKKSEKDWRAELSEEEFRILRQKGTELPFSGEYNDHYQEGAYLCKYNSHCGWPSYDRAIEGSLIEVPDNSAGMTRTEIVCANCGGHQGHVFNDGPTETGLRYCVNSASISFKKRKG